MKVVLLVAFLRMPGWDDNTEGLDLVEFFAGKARTSKLAAWMGFKSRAFDIEYHPTRHPFEPKHGMRPRSCMDINGPAGFALLCPSKVFQCFGGICMFRLRGYRSVFWGEPL